MENFENLVSVENLLDKLKYMEIEMAHHYTCRGPLFAKEHLHEITYHICYIINGKCTVAIDGKKQNVSNGYVIYIPPGFKHVSFDDTKVNFELVEIKFSFQKHSFTAGMSKFPATLVVQDRAGLVSAFERFLESYTVDGRDNWLTKIRLTEVIMLLYNERSASSEMSSLREIDLKIKQVVKYMQLRYADLLTVQNLSELVNLSASYFANSFKSVMGISPIELVIDIRLNRAKELLQSSGLTITEISRICGFSSPKYMDRLFSRKLNMTPTMFRKKLGNVNPKTHIL